MHTATASTQAIIALRAIGFLLLWYLLFECAHLLVMPLRHGPLIGWGVGPFGVTVLSLQEPPTFYIWLNVLVPAFVSGLVLYLGLFTPIALLRLRVSLLVEIVIIGCGVLFSSTLDFLNALRDVRFPLWGEARLLWTLQTLQSSWAAIHFTPFGRMYLRDHFDVSPTEILHVM